MKRRFIALIDFSDHSEWLLSFSYRWSREVNAELLLIHRSTEMLPGMVDTESRNEMRRDSAERSIARLNAFVEERLGADTTIKYHGEPYNIAAAILELQTPEIRDYIFVGMNERSSLENLVIGSTALHLTEEIKSIIIGLPTTRYDFHFDKFHVAVKDTYPLKEAEFSDLLSIKQHMTQQAGFFSVLKPGNDHEKAEEYLNGLCARFGNDIQASYEILEGEDTVAVIKEYMLANNGVLVIQKGSRSLLDMFRRFFTTEMIRDAYIPVIILP